LILEGEQRRRDTEEISGLALTHYDESDVEQGNTEQLPEHAEKGVSILVNEQLDVHEHHDGLEHEAAVQVQAARDRSTLLVSLTANFKHLRLRLV